MEDIVKQSEKGLTPSDKAIQLLQQIANTTHGEDCTNGNTLPLSVTKRIAHIMVDELIFSAGFLNTQYWIDVKEQLNVM